MRILCLLMSLAICGGVKAAAYETRVEYHGPRTVHVLKIPKGAAMPKSFAVKNVPPKTDAASSEIAVSEKAPGVLEFRDRRGGLLLAEKDEAEFCVHRRASTVFKRARQEFSIPAGEALFGLGDLENGKILANGIDERLVPANVGDGIPYLLSVKGWAVFWDNSSPTRFTDVPGEFTAFDSQVAEVVDYWFFFGGSADGCVAEMRKLTGDVPMLPRWAYGYWQSREHYATQDEIVSVARRYRAEGIPFDGIVQDWHYWGDWDHWNAMDFLSPDYPDPRRMVDDIHACHARLLLSIWPCFGPKTEAYELMKRGGHLLAPYSTYPKTDGVRYYDAFSPEARKLYYDLMGRFVDLGIDGWWLDATDLDFPNCVTFYDHGQEDDTLDIYDVPTAAGPFRSVRMAYSLCGVEDVYERTRRDPRRNDRRVFILTRAAAAGQQRTGSAVWSGDTESNWDSLRRQVAAGCSYSLTGNPNFNCDIGGFGAIHYALGKSAEEATKHPLWHELYVRWMQLGTFLPMMRSHGTSIVREIYYYGKKGEPVYDSLMAAIRLRYALMPYIYGTAWRCCDGRYTMMRALMMDFPDDPEAVRCADEFMFGGALLVAPVLDHAVSSREVYLPKGTKWWNFFTEKSEEGGRRFFVRTPLDTIPVYVRAGSIVPIGPDVQYNGEKPWDDLEIRVYPGADGSFVLYEDDFETYACERGERSEITFAWNDQTKTLTVSAPKGKPFPGQLRSRRFRIRLPGAEPKVLDYNNEAISVTLP